MSIYTENIQSPFDSEPLSSSALGVGEYGY